MSDQHAHFMLGQPAESHQYLAGRGHGQEPHEDGQLAGLHVLREEVEHNVRSAVSISRQEVVFNETAVRICS